MKFITLFLTGCMKVGPSIPTGPLFLTDWRAWSARNAKRKYAYASRGHLGVRSFAQGGVRKKKLLVVQVIWLIHGLLQLPMWQSWPRSSARPRWKQKRCHDSIGTWWARISPERGAHELRFELKLAQVGINSAWVRRTQACQSDFKPKVIDLYAWCFITESLNKFDLIW